MWKPSRRWEPRIRPQFPLEHTSSMMIPDSRIIPAGLSRRNSVANELRAARIPVTSLPNMIESASRERGRLRIRTWPTTHSIQPEALRLMRPLFGVPGVASFIVNIPCPTTPAAVKLVVATFVTDTTKRAPAQSTVSYTRESDPQAGS